MQILQPDDKTELIIAVHPLLEELVSYILPQHKELFYSEVGNGFKNMCELGMVRSLLLRIVWIPLTKHDHHRRKSAI